MVLTGTVLVSFRPIMGDAHSMHKFVCHRDTSFIQVLLGDPHAKTEPVLIEQDRTGMYLMVSF